MPLYDYLCAACGRRFEVIHGLDGDPPTSCPLCGKGPVRKAFVAPAVHFKGSGWAKKERRASKAGSGSGSSTSSGGDDSSDGGSASDKGGSGSDKSGTSTDQGGSASSGSVSTKGSGTSTPSTSGSTGD